MEARPVALPERWFRPASVCADARRPHGEPLRRILPAAGLLMLLAWTAALPAATVTTRNFVVHASSPEIAEQVGKAAEYYRRELAIAWLGKELPPWYRPCPIKVKVGQIGAGGATTFTFEGGEVFGWNMNVQGSLERILDSVIPHEVSHTIFASYFRRPLPRWADEGAATLVEHESERMRQTKLLTQVIRTSRRIPLQQLLEITEYPQDMQQVLTLYAEGYSLADFLVQLKGDEGRATYLAFLNDAHQHNWLYAFQKHYGFSSLGEVEKKWSSWVLAGSPPLLGDKGTLLADAGKPRAETNADVRGRDAASGSLVRGQTPPPLPPLPPIQRPLRDRLTGQALEAPEPAMTAMPQRGGDARFARSSEAAAEAAPPIPLEGRPLASDSGETGFDPRVQSAPQPQDSRSRFDLPAGYGAPTNASSLDQAFAN